jgi:hypothetical protein
LIEYILIISILQSRVPVEIGRETYQTFEECTAASHEKQVDFGKQGLYNITTQCRREVHEDIYEQAKK